MLTSTGGLEADAEAWQRGKEAAVKKYSYTGIFPPGVDKFAGTVDECHVSVESPAEGAQLKVMGMSPGSYAWKEIEIIELDKFAGQSFATNTIPENVNSLYLEYVAAGECKIAVDDLTIVYGGTVTSSSAHEVYTNYSTGAVSSIHLTDLEPDTQYEYNVQAVNDTHHARVSDTIVVRTRELSGVENVGADGGDDTPAEYFNLQGIRIAAPHRGEICIERRGNTARKMIAK